MVVNLGTCILDEVDTVSVEERVLEHIEFFEEVTIFGGFSASETNVGSGSNANTIVEMNLMFEFWNCDGIKTYFLGSCEVSLDRDSNMSTLSK